MDLTKAYELIVKKLSTWLQDFISLLPNILLAVVIIVLGFFIAKRIKKFSRRFVTRLVKNVTLHNLVISIIYVFFLAITIFVSLSVLKLDKAVTSILAGAGIAGLALAFAFQDIAANFMSGIFISIRHPFHIGDVIKIKDYMGSVEEINLRDTIIRTFQGQMVILPNKDVFQNPIENYTLLGRRRFDLQVGVSYGDDLEKVEAVTLDAVKNIEEICADEELTFFYTSFGDSSINFVIRLWVSTADQPAYLTAGSKAIKNIKKAYEEHGITIPFPIRTLDFGIKGGQPLSEMDVNIRREH